MMDADESCTQFSNDTIEQIRQLQSKFATDRDWDQFHTPRNLLLAMVGEVGELSEIFLWKEDLQHGLKGWCESEVQHLGEELSDVLLYLIRLSEKCHCDLSNAVKQLLNNKYQIRHHLSVLDRDIEKEFQKHSQKSITLALVRDVGKVAESFQWKGEVEVNLPGWSTNELSKLTNRLAVVLVDLVFLSLRCEIDLPNVVKKKIIKNGLKYPVGLSNGSSKKYTELNGKLVANGV
ncbi:uncharacterized protein [Clytia hemisphaerica]|uniref:uncharacterized protein isoform X2 n=1 Tax=Clytia hemisphaerica TaxID=252671 RepID=UPI0034D71510